uniref:Uncharacterized protein n=1 Tax=Arundo donax TaxID=35708 RepID=A0A0A8YTM4_ARUDO
MVFRRSVSEHDLLMRIGRNRSSSAGASDFGEGAVVLFMLLLRG